MADNAKIPFSFCRIKRAAAFLGIQTEDILSLAVSGKITLCIRFTGLSSIIYCRESVESLNQWFQSLDIDGSVLAFAKKTSDYSSFAIDNLTHDPDSDEAIFYPKFYPSKNADGENLVTSSQSHKGRAFGLWVPQTPVINTILNVGRSELMWGSFGLYQTDDSTPDLCIVPLPLNYEEYDEIQDDDDYKEIYPEIEITEDDLWITSEQVREMVKYNGDYSDLPVIAKKGIISQEDIVNDTKKINHIAEHHATNREKLFKSAIFLLSKYPDECRGEKKEISPEKWRDCLLAHKDEVPPLAINNEDVILKHLRSAANGRINN